MAIYDQDTTPALVVVTVPQKFLIIEEENKIAVYIL